MQRASEGRVGGALAVSVSVMSVVSVSVMSVVSVSVMSVSVMSVVSGLAPFSERTGPIFAALRACSGPQPCKTFCDVTVSCEQANYELCERVYGACHGLYFGITIKDPPFLHSRPHPRPSWYSPPRGAPSSLS